MTSIPQRLFLITSKQAASNIKGLLALTLNNQYNHITLQNFKFAISQPFETKPVIHLDFLISFPLNDKVPSKNSAVIELFESKAFWAVVNSPSLSRSTT